MSIKNIIRQNQSSHYYWPDGRPAFEVNSADGKKKVKTTIVQAKKLGLYPSVTTVMKVIDKPEIDTWRVERAIKASISSRREAGERIKTFIERIVEKAQSRSTKAVNFGSDIHSYIEAKLNGQSFESIYIPAKTKDSIAKHLETHVTAPNCEVVAINKELGYGGTIDLICTLSDGRRCMYDFKTQGTKPARSFMYYRDFIIQLGAYSLCDKFDCVRSLIISSTEAGRIEFKEYTPEEISWGARIFSYCIKLFRLINNMEKT